MPGGVEPAGAQRLEITVAERAARPARVVARCVGDRQPVGADDRRPVGEAADHDVEQCRRRAAAGIAVRTASRGVPGCERLARAWNAVSVSSTCSLDRGRRPRLSNTRPPTVVACCSRQSVPISAAAPAGDKPGAADERRNVESSSARLRQPHARGARHRPGAESRAKVAAPAHDRCQGPSDRARRRRRSSRVARPRGSRRGRRASGRAADPAGAGRTPRRLARSRRRVRRDAPAPGCRVHGRRPARSKAGDRGTRATDAALARAVMHTDARAVPERTRASQADAGGRRRAG